MVSYKPQIVYEGCSVSKMCAEVIRGAKPLARMGLNRRRDAGWIHDIDAEYGLEDYGLRDRTSVFMFLHRLCLA